MNIEYDEEKKRQNYLEPADISNPNLIYVCVALAKPGDKDRFFILTKADLQADCIQNYKNYMEPKDWKRPKNPESYDCRYNVTTLKDYEDKWDLIKHRLAGVAPAESFVNPKHT